MKSSLRLKSQIPNNLTHNKIEHASQPSQSAAPNYFKADSALENLPPELRIQILLELTDWRSLRSLARASPSYHASYLEAGREKILCHVALSHQLDPRIHADAFAAVRSGRFYERRFSTNREGERAIAFLDEYGHARGNSAHSNSEWLSCRSMTEATDLIHLHEAVKYVAAEYSLAAASKMRQGQQPMVLSQMEELRLHRAIYRFQIYCNFFGNNPCMPQIDAWGGWARAHHPIKRFLPSFPPWEVVEIGCVWQYLMKRWPFIVKELSYTKHTAKHGLGDERDMLGAFARLDFTAHDLSDRDASLGSSPNEDSNLHIKHDARKRCQYLAHLGPHFLAKTLAIETLKGRREATKDTHPMRVFRPFDEMLDYAIPLEGLIHPADKYQNPDSPVQLSQMPESEQPSRGWEWFCNRYKVRAFGIGEEVWPGQASISIRKHSKHEMEWGFPFWDKEKLEMWGQIQVMDDAIADSDDASVEESPTLFGGDLGGFFGGD